MSEDSYSRPKTIRMITNYVYWFGFFLVTVFGVLYLGLDPRLDADTLQAGYWALIYCVSMLAAFIWLGIVVHSDDEDSRMSLRSAMFYVFGLQTILAWFIRIAVFFLMDNYIIFMCWFSFMLLMFAYNDQIRTEHHIKLPYKIDNAILCILVAINVIFLIGSCSFHVLTNENYWEVTKVIVQQFWFGWICVLCNIDFCNVIRKNYERDGQMMNRKTLPQKLTVEDSGLLKRHKEVNEELNVPETPIPKGPEQV